MKGLDSAQVEQLQQIGEYLYHLREQQAISLEEIAKNTFIPLRLLEAIELADAARLPEPVYVKGFIRRYADALGVDGSEIAEAFPVQSYPAPQSSEEPIAGSTSSSDYGSTSLATHQDQPSRAFTPYIPYAVAGVIALVAVGAIAIGASNAFRSNSPQKPDTQAVPNSAPSTATNPQTTPDTPSSSSSSPTSESTLRSEAPSSNALSDAPVKVDVTLADRSWMEVVIDDKVEFEGTLAKGEQRTWVGKKRVEIRAGNAGGVMVAHNQGDAKPLGKLGEVVDISFTNEQEPQENSGTVSQQ